MSKEPCFISASCVQAELEKQVQREKAMAEAEGKIKERRQNEDIYRRCALQPT